MLSIEITRECPLHCPGCYAYNDDHLGGGVKLRELADRRGDALVDGVLGLVRRHAPLHVSLVGGEPLVRHRELSRILPELSRMGVFSLVVTSAVIPIPMEWMKLPRVRVAVSVDGLPPEHDVRRKPATYERILENISGRQVNIHLTITRPMTERAGYLDEFFRFWSARPEVLRIWVSWYTPQVGEESPERILPEARPRLAAELVELRRQYPKVLLTDGIARAFTKPPADPAACLFAKMSVNYSADFRTRVEPCVYGGAPNCAECGCAMTAGAEHLADFRLLGPLRAGHLVRGSIAIGSFVDRFRKEPTRGRRWGGGRLVQIRPTQ